MPHWDLDICQKKGEGKKADAFEKPKSKHFVNIRHASPQTRMRYLY